MDSRGVALALLEVPRSPCVPRGRAWVRYSCACSTASPSSLLAHLCRSRPDLRGCSHFLGLRGPTHRSVIAGTLWPEVPEQQSLGSLRTGIWRINRLVPGLLETRRLCGDHDQRSLRRQPRPGGVRHPTAERPPGRRPGDRRHRDAVGRWPAARVVRRLGRVRARAAAPATAPCARAHGQRAAGAGAPRDRPPGRSRGGARGAAARDLDRGADVRLPRRGERRRRAAPLRRRSARCWLRSSV